MDKILYRIVELVTSAAYLLHGACSIDNVCNFLFQRNGVLCSFVSILEVYLVLADVY